MESQRKCLKQENLLTKGKPFLNAHLSIQENDFVNKLLRQRKTMDAMARRRV